MALLLTNPDYVNMSLRDALHLARTCSGKSEEEVGADMSWSQGNTARIFGEDSYWPTLPSIPKLCVILGNNILIDWLHANAHAGGVQHEFPALDCAQLLQELALMTQDLGHAAEECRKAVASPGLSQPEARRLVKKLLRLCSDTMHTIRGLRPIAASACQED